MKRVPMNGHIKTNITLRPVSNGGDGRRLGLYTAEFRLYVQGKSVKELYVDFGEGKPLNIPALKTYAHGSITNPIVNDWLHRHGWKTPDEQLIFTLEIDDVKQVHTYRFVKHLFKFHRDNALF